MLRSVIISWAVHIFLRNYSASRAKRVKGPTVCVLVILTFLQSIVLPFLLVGVVNNIVSAGLHGILIYWADLGLS